MYQQYPLNIYLYQSGLTWDDRYETSPYISPTYPISREIVKVL